MSALYEADPGGAGEVPAGLASAVMPALRLAQERVRLAVARGDPRGRRRARVTPAYCQSVASFYDQFHLEPVGEHSSRSARTSRARSSAPGRCWRRSRGELGCHAGETSADGKVTLRDDRVPRRLRLGDDRRGRRPLPAARQGRGRAGDRRGAPVATDVTQIVLGGTEDHDLTQLAGYEAVGGYQALAKARALTPQEVTEELIASELRGRGGAFFPTGRKWSFVPSKEQIPKPHYLVVNADESEPGSFKDNEILSRVPHRFIEGCLITAHAIDCTHVFVYIRGEYSGPYEILVAALEELKGRPEIRGDVDDRAPPRRRRVHLRRGDGAARVARGQARPAALEAAVPGGRGPLRVADRRQQRRDDHDRPADHRAWAARSTRSSASQNSRGTRVVSLSGNVVDGRQLRDRARHEPARPDLRHRRRHPRRARAEGGRSGRLVDGDPERGRDRRRLRLRLARCKLGTAMGSAA